MKDLTLSVNEVTVIVRLRAGQTIYIANWPCASNIAVFELERRGYVEVRKGEPGYNDAAFLTDAGRKVEVGS